MGLSLFTDNFPKISTEKELDALKAQFSNYDGYYIASATTPERKQLFDSLYSQYAPYADSHFLPEVKLHFHQRTWEMYLACVLLKYGFKITSNDEGPDIQITTRNNKKVWIECVASEKGEGDDRVPVFLYGTALAQPMPEREILLRLSNSLKSKFEKCQDYLSKNTVGQDDIFVIAVNRGALDDINDKCPLILKCLFSIGDLNWFERVEDGKAEEPYYARRAEVDKKSGEAVSMNFFEDPQHAGISAVIYSQELVLNHPDKLGDDCILVHNPFANNPLPEDIFSFFKQYKRQSN